MKIKGEEKPDILLYGLEAPAGGVLLVQAELGGGHDVAAEGG